MNLQELYAYQVNRGSSYVSTLQNKGIEVKNANVIELKDALDQAFQSKLTDASKKLIKTYCEEENSLSESLTFKDMFPRAWTKIMNHKDKEELLRRLDEEVMDMPQGGRSSRLVRLANVFSGFDEC